jgi:hypothetical protein
MATNSKDPSLISLLLRFGKQRLSLNADFLLGWCCTIELLQLTTWLKRIGTAILFAPFASVSKKLLSTSYCSATLQKLYETCFNLTMVFLVVTLLNKGGPIEWVHYLISAYSKPEQKNKLGMLFMFWW